jgi:superfamily II DNA or RNA helicase
MLPNSQNKMRWPYVLPYVEGGSTDVLNGQALCPTCNLMKGASAMQYQWPVSYQLRQWQSEFLTTYRTWDQADFLLVATPGAGKTIASLRVAHELLNSGVVEQVVVVCPTDHLRNQWLQDAAKVNIHLDKLILGWTSEIALTRDYVGLVTTYAQVANKQEHLRAFCKRKTFVIFDEIHHCGEADHLSWGPAINRAFSPATRRLLLSGTPFRSDNNQIPFVKYETDASSPNVRRAVADFSYGYGDALRDEYVVRHVIFPGWDGKFVWEDMFGEEKQASFDSVLNLSESAQRLRTAIHYEGDAIRTVIALANEKLNYIRVTERHEEAGGLIVAQDQTAAYALAKIVEEISGEKPVIAVSDDDAASDNIHKFRHGRQKWIVAVKMVSEGVDIKRLRVGVYATNITTRTFFRQVIGRVIRWDSKWNDVLEDQNAWFYVPNDQQLIEFMREIKEEIVDVIREQETQDKQGRGDQPRQAPMVQLPLGSGYQFKYSDGEEKHHHFNGYTFALDELDEAQRIFAELGPGFERVAAAPKALFLRNFKERANVDSGNTPTQKSLSLEQPTITRHDQKTVLKTQIRKKAGRLVRVCQQNNILIPGNNPYQTINNAWGRKVGYSHELTNEDLEKKLTWLEGLIQRALQNDRNIVLEFR